jgi:hypothetical protein
MREQLNGETSGLKVAEKVVKKLYTYTNQMIDEYHSQSLELAILFSSVMTYLQETDKDIEEDKLKIKLKEDEVNKNSALLKKVQADLTSLLKDIKNEKEKENQMKEDFTEFRVLKGQQKTKEESLSLVE